MKSAIVQYWQAFLRNKPLFWAVTLVLGWRIALESLHMFIFLFLPHVNVGTSFLNANAWSQWDGNWYLDIINSGYRHTDHPEGAENFAFFPLFPSLVSILSTLFFLPPLYAGLLLNLVLTGGIAYFIYGIAQKVCERLEGKGEINTEKVGIISVVGVLLYPSSLFFAAFYAEAILILGITGAIYFALCRRLWIAVLCASIATACKSMGLVSLPVIGIIVLEQWIADKQPARELIKRWLVIPVGLSGLLAYILYLWIAFGQPLLFYTAVQAWGRNTASFFLTEIWTRYYSHIFEPAYFGWPYTYIMMLFTLSMPFLVLALGAYVARTYRMWWPLALSFVAVAIPLSSGVMESVNRYLMVCAPLMVFVAIWVSRKDRKWAFALFAIPALLLVYFTYHFLKNGRFAG